MSEAIVRIEDVSKHYGAVHAVDGVSLAMERGEFFALLGPSGCGKTSLMRLVAGFETPDAGRIVLDGRDMAGVPPHRRPVNMMFQSYALFPHMSVARNIGFGLVQQGLARGEIEARVNDMLRRVRLQGFGERKPHQLSGGQRQRVALARALAPRPKLLLLDEPLGALDRKLREETQFELMQVQRDLGVAFMVVTHDQDEAMAMAQRIALMRAGRIEQVGAPREIYDEPASRFVADFIGEANLFSARVRREGENLVAESCGAIPFRLATKAGAGDCVVVVRPERMALSHLASGCVHEAAGVIEDMAWRGDSSHWRVRLEDGFVVRVSRSNADAAARIFQRGDRVFVGFDPDAARVVTP